MYFLRFLAGQHIRREIIPVKTANQSAVCVSMVMDNLYTFAPE